MRLPRMTTRRWMIAVCGLAVTLGTERTAQRWDAYRQRAEGHEATLRTLASVRQRGRYPYCSLGFKGIPLLYNAETASFHAECVSRHTHLARKYRFAMLTPWLSVEPDPPL